MGSGSNDVSYSTIRFVESALSTHPKVLRYERTRDVFFSIDLHNGRQVKVLLTGKYRIGEAEILEILREFPEAECILAAGEWCEFTRDAKDQAKQLNRTPLKPKQLIAMLHRMGSNVQESRSPGRG